MTNPRKMMMAAAGAGAEGGTLWTWGRNPPYYQLGIGGGVDKSTPVQVGSEENWTVATTGDNTNQWLNADGEIYGSGLNNHGNYGTGNVTTYSSPQLMVDPPSGTKVFVDLYIGGYGGIAVADDGTLWTWGDNGKGQLGNQTATTLDVSSPIQVGSLTDWAKCSGCENSYTMIKTDGTLWGMGKNNEGQLGDGTKIGRSSPVQIGSLTTWDRIPSCTQIHRYAIKTDNSLWVYGDGGQGRLGNSSSVNRSSPVQITGSWLDAGGGQDFGIGIKTDGTLWGWGYNISGQNGSGNTVTSSSPVQIGSLTSWESCATLNQSGFAIKTDGTAWAWGANSNGCLGISTVTNRSSPVQIASATTWSSLAKSCTGNAMAAIQGG